MPSSVHCSLSIQQQTGTHRIELEEGFLQRILQMQQAEEELRCELRRLLAQAGYPAEDISRLIPERPPHGDLNGLRQRYVDGVHANEQLRGQLQGQLAACETDRRDWQERSKQLESLHGDLLRCHEETGRKHEAGQPLDLSQSSGLTMEDLAGLCHDLSQSLRASKALQTDLSHSLSASATPMVSYLQHEKDRLVHDVTDLHDRLAKLEAENKTLRSSLIGSRPGR